MNGLVDSRGKSKGKKEGEGWVSFFGEEKLGGKGGKGGEGRESALDVGR